MTAADILARLDAQNVTIGLDGSDLHIEAAPGTMKPEWVEYLRSHKAEIVAHLRERHTPPDEPLIAPTPCTHCNAIIEPPDTGWMRTGPDVVHMACMDSYGLALAKKYRRFIEAPPDRDMEISAQDTAG